MSNAQRYDELLDRGAPTRGACPVCDGDEGGEPCGETCDWIMRVARMRRQVRRAYEQARACLALARRYRIEDGVGEHREHDAVRTATYLRQQIMIWRRAMQYGPEIEVTCAECEDRYPANGVRWVGGLPLCASCVPTDPAIRIPVEFAEEPSTGIRARGEEEE